MRSVNIVADNIEVLTLILGFGDDLFPELVGSNRSSIGVVSFSIFVNNRSSTDIGGSAFSLVVDRDISSEGISDSAFTAGVNCTFSSAGALVFSVSVSSKLSSAVGGGNSFSVEFGRNVSSVGALSNSSV